MSAETSARPLNPLPELNASEKEIELLFRAKAPLIWITSPEEWRVLERLELVRAHVIRNQIEDCEARRSRLQPTDPAGQSQDPETLRRLDEYLELLRQDRAHRLVRWAPGLLMAWGANREDRTALDENAVNPLETILGIRSVHARLYDGNQQEGAWQKIHARSAWFVFSDLHPWLDREDRNGRFNVMLVRALRDLAHLLPKSPFLSSLVFISPKSVVPLELSKDLHVVDFPLPNMDDLGREFNRVIEEYPGGTNALSDDEHAKLLRSLAGLTLSEAGGVVRKAVVAHGGLNAKAVDEIHNEKKQIIRKEGILEFVDTTSSIKEDVGGLEVLAEWLDRRSGGFPHGDVEVDGHRVDLPVPKGVLLIGVPGGGKSLVCKKVAKGWGVPLLRMDVGKIYAGLVGESEANMRRVIRLAESVAPVIVWIDEVEKAFPQTTGELDSGVSRRVMHTFLTWLQEKSHPVFVVATANDITRMPMEMTRKGRFDEIFYVGLPNKKDRRRIVEIHVGKQTQDRVKTLPPPDLDALAEASQYFTGAEIEQAVKNALYLMRHEVPVPPSGQRLKHPFAQAIWHCMQPGVLTPLAKRRSDDGKLALEKTLSVAKAIAVEASKEFEHLPPSTEEPPTDRFQRTASAY
jgi:hypothetical protein